ncbi:MAG: ABC transporter ATP-binding protein [Firmicutes bacterium]|nr:ABC transporter ATP-binding protein [Bacillota bacterium]
MYLELKNITKRFADTRPEEPDAVSHVDLGIEKGELIALLGPSGSGKTTLLRMIAGLDAPTEGEIYIDGECVNDLSPADRRVGFVFQNYALFRYMTVYENVAFGLDVQKRSKDEVRKRVGELLDLIELSHLRDRYPNQLSGGQRQRVAFARALATQPALLLLDEPFAAIDAKVRKELRRWLREMIHEVGVTSIFVTHDQEEAVDMADRIVILKDGKLEQAGSPYDVYKNPKTAFSATFMGDSVVLDKLCGFTGFEDITDGRKIVIRPEYVEAFRDDNPKFHHLIPYSNEGIVRDVVFRGDSVELIIEVNGERLMCRRSMERRPVSTGEKMRVLLYRVNVFDEEGAQVLANETLQDVDVEFM